MMKLVSMVAAAVLMSASSVPASARDFIDHPSTTPLLYIYASCVFGSSEPTADARIASCAPVKDQIDEQSDHIIARFHRDERAVVRRESNKGLREIENDAGTISDQGKEVPAIIVSYLHCMGSSMMDSEAYKRGDAVDYTDIEGLWFNNTIAGEQQLSPIQLKNVQILYRRFHRSGRFRPSLTMDMAREHSRSMRRAPERRLFDRSFLNPSLMKAERDD